MTSINAFLYMKDLKKLEEFHFEIACSQFGFGFIHVSRMETVGWIYSLCAQNVPQLRLIGGPFDLAEYMFRYFTPIFSGTSSLETLHATGCLPEASLPNLKELLFIHDENIECNILPKLSSFKNLTTLGISTTDEDMLHQVLVSVGAQLSSLSVEIMIQHVDLYYKIFHSCPNLVKVELLVNTGSYSQVSQHKELVGEKNFLRLEEIKCGYSVDGSFIFPPGLLPLIFQAPKMRIIDFGHFSIQKEDCVWLRDVREGRFQRLERVNLSNLQLDPRCEMDEFALMVKLLVCGAINLKSFKISWDNYIVSYDEHNWLYEQPQAIKILNLLQKKL